MNGGDWGRNWRGEVCMSSTVGRCWDSRSCRDSSTLEEDHSCVSGGGDSAAKSFARPLTTSFLLTSLFFCRIGRRPSDTTPPPPPPCKALLIFSPLFSSSFFLIEFSTHHFTCCCCWIFVFQPAFVSPQFPFFFFQLFRSSISHLSCHFHFLKLFLGTVALNLIWVFLISSVYVL